MTDLSCAPVNKKAPLTHQGFRRSVGQHLGEKSSEGRSAQLKLALSAFLSACKPLLGPPLSNPPSLPPPPFLPQNTHTPTHTHIDTGSCSARLRQDDLIPCQAQRLITMTNHDRILWWALYRSRRWRIEQTR